VLLNRRAHPHLHGALQVVIGEWNRHTGLLAPVDADALGACRR